jgi:hypothetical protein
MSHLASSSKNFPFCEFSDILKTFGNCPGVLELNKWQPTAFYKLGFYVNKYAADMPPMMRRGRGTGITWRLSGT